MARFQPPIDPASLPNSGERAVAQALAGQLPDSVIIYHGLPFLERQRSQSGREFFREGEIDFILLDRTRGLLVLEVKGGTVTWSPDEGYRRLEAGGKIRSPFEQARDNMHVLLDRIREHPPFRDGRLPFTRGYAVVLPHCNWSGALPPDVQPETLLTFDDLPHLGARVAALFDLWSRRDQHAPLDAAAVRGIRAALEAALNLIPVLQARVADQEDCLVRVTAEQARVLDCLRALPRVACNGVAGSGKTLLALAQARALAHQGRRTLLLCYNRPLADWLAAQLTADLAGHVTVANFHTLCQTVCERTGVPFPVRPNDADFWDYEAPDCLERAALLLPDDERFEALVVDEGQDFFSLWFPALRLVTRRRDDDFPLWWFYDPRQNLRVPFDQAALPPNLAGPVLLSRNCRNTRRISQRCRAIIGEDFDLLDTLPEGDEVRELTAAAARDVVQLTRRQVLDWTGPGGRLRPRQIAILTAGKPGAEWPTHIGPWPLANDFDRWRRDECLLLSPHRRFKGLEADALVLAGVPEPGSSPYFTTADHYVACSRAKHLLTVITRPKDSPAES